MKIAIYTRKSVAVERSESISTQIEMCKKYFKGKNEFEIFEDEGFSGGNTNRPSFKKMMSLVKLGKFDAVAVYKVDRIARNIVDFFKIFDELEKYNVKLISITEGFDPSTPSGKMMMIMLAGFADMERENIRQRVKDNMIALAKKGCYTGGFVPFGCVTVQIEGKSYLQVKDKDLIKLIFKKYYELGSLYSTQKYLKDNGFKTMSNRSSLNGLLRNPVYAKSSKEINDYFKANGYLVHGTPNGKGYITYGKTVNESMLIVSNHTAPVSADLFLKVNKMLDEKRENAIKRFSKTYWLTGTLYCPFCGGKYTIANSARKTYYLCSNRLNRKSDDSGIDPNKEKCSNNKYINAEELEKKVEELIKRLDQSELFEKYYKKSVDNVEDNEDNEIDILNKTFNENEVAIKNLIDKLALVSNEAAKYLVEKIDNLTEQNKEISANIDNLKLKRLEKSTKISKEEAQDLIARFNKINDPNEKRLILNKVFEKLVYNPFEDTLDIHFN